MLKRGRGFTLIEMAIVLVIVGLILATTLPLLTERMARDKATKGARSLNTLKQEIIGYAMIEGHLPTADYVSDNFSGAEDTWGNAVAYYPAAGLPAAKGSGNTISGASTPTNLNLVRTVSGPTSNTYPDMGFILVSTGPNNHAEAGWDSGPTGDGDAGYTGDYEYFDRGGYGLQGGYYYDDIVEYVTLGFLQTKVDDSQGGGGPSNSAGSFEEDGVDGVLDDASTTGDNSVIANASKNPVIINTDTNELDLGGVDGAVGCAWYASTNATIPCEPNGNGAVLCSPGSVNGTAWHSLHFVMRFNFVNKDYYGRDYNQRYSGGWVFAVISGVAGTNILGTAPCGGGEGSDLGYLGYAYGYASGNPISDPKFGVEVDIFKNLGQHGTQTRLDPDTTVGAANYQDWGTYGELNHISNVYWDFDHENSGLRVSRQDDNEHELTDGTNSNPGYDAANATGMFSGRAADSNLMWLEDGEDHWMRVELWRTNSSTSGAGDVTYTTYVWLDDSPNAVFLNVGTSMVGTAAGNYEYATNSSVTYSLGTNWSGGNNINAMMNTFRFGWTTATGNDSARDGQNPNSANIGQFGWNFTTF